MKVGSSAMSSVGVSCKLLYVHNLEKAVAALVAERAELQRRADLLSSQLLEGETRIAELQGELKGMIARECAL